MLYYFKHMSALKKPNYLTKKVGTKWGLENILS